MGYQRELPLARFHVLIVGVVISLALVTLLVIAGGDRTEPIPRTVEPGDGATMVPGSSSVVVRFNRPVDLSAIREFVSIDPPTPGAWTVERGLARFVPFGGLRPETAYALTLRAGFTDVSGRALRRDLTFTFETRPSLLVFSRHEPSVTDVLAPRNLWMTTWDGQNPRQVTHEPLGILFAAVAPDGERIAYSAANPASPNASDLWIVNADGTGRQQLAGDLDGAILSVSWSPRGDMLAYERRSVLSARGDLGRPRVLAVRPDGGGGGLLYGRGEEAGAQPIWSPDGRRLLVADAAGGGRRIIDLAGETILIPSGGTDAGAWSPDGQLLAFADLVQERDATRSVIRVSRADGTVIRDLDRPGYSDTAPAWSPDGGSIAVIGQHQDGQVAIWLLDPAGTSARAVPLATPDPGGMPQLTPPVWSTGGALLSFSRLVSSGGAVRWEVWVARGDGSSARQVAADGLAEGWAP
jgi:Tol biopolymer transport system component